FCAGGFHDEPGCEIPRLVADVVEDADQVGAHATPAAPSPAVPSRAGPGRGPPAPALQARAAPSQAPPCLALPASPRRARPLLAAPCPACHVSPCSRQHLNLSGRVDLIRPEVTTLLNPPLTNTDTHAARVDQGHH